MAMRAKPVSVTISNYAHSSDDTEVIELDGTTPTSVHYTKFGHGKVSPTPSHNNYVDDGRRNLTQKPRRQKCANTFLMMSFIFSMVALVLVCGVHFGNIEPRHTRKLNGCSCENGMKGRTKSTAYISENGKDDLPSEIQELKNDVRKIKDDLESTKTSFGSEKDINELKKKINVETERKLADLSRKIDSRFRNIEKQQNDTEKRLFNNIENTVSEIDQMGRDIQQNMTQKILQRNAVFDSTLKKSNNETAKRILESEKNYEVKLQEVQRSTLKNISNVIRKLDHLQTTSNKKFDNFKNEFTKNVTNSLQKLEKYYFVTEKFINETNKEMSETKNFTKSMLQKNLEQVGRMNISIWEKISTMRGPRGYNGSNGVAGPPGPQGAEGKQGPRGLTIRGCKNHTEAKLVNFRVGKWEFAKITLKSQNEIYFNEKCEASSYGSAFPQRKANSFICECMNKPGTLKNYTCFLKYERCTLVSI